MIENTIQKYKVANPKNNNCQICAGISSIYGVDSFQNELTIPADIGQGYWRRMIVRPSMEIALSDLTFSSAMTMRARLDKPLYSLAFCLGDPLIWQEEGNRMEYELAGGESCIFKRNRENSICSYKPGERFWGLAVQLDADIIVSIMQHLGQESFRAGSPHDGSMFYKRKYSSAVRLILNDIINCRYQDQVKRIYLEGKVLELIAVYLDEAVFEKGKAYSPAKLSLADIKSLREARGILDANIAVPPTLEKLAKLVCINEYKLKTGFKELFGMPVHAYIIDKRMETARFLIVDKKLKVTEAALLVGYSDASHFAKKFRKKYSVNPSEYR